MPNLKGFWSYVHDDDKAEKGRIAQLVHDIVDQYGLITGDRIEVFLDKDDLNWGDKWRDKIDNNLGSIAFFIPVLTPRYLMSVECRREMQYFLSKAIDLGISELLLPLLYVKIPQMADTESEDELLKIIKSTQYEDWTETRFFDSSSTEYRRAVNALAKRLVEVNKNYETHEGSKPGIGKDLQPGKEEGPGFIDLLAEMESTLPEWGSTIIQLTREIENVGKIVKEENVNVSNNSTFDSYSKRLAIMRQLANRLSDPSENIWQLSNKVANQINSIDAGFKVIFERAPEEIKNDPASRKKYVDLMSSIKLLINSAKESFVSVERMIQSLSSIEALSREIRPVIRKMKQGLIIYSQTKDYFYRWDQIIDNLSL